ncbi:MAG: hypothetical protein JWO67_1366 [Streptosporangiaceae bacterium]|jgi:hypothetical protein|nr:hypothetical protein [Streptosporangiaceae bacterium]
MDNQPGCGQCNCSLGEREINRVAAAMRDR